MAQDINRNIKIKVESSAVKDINDIKNKLNSLSDSLANLKALASSIPGEQKKGIKELIDAYREEQKAIKEIEKAEAEANKRRSESSKKALEDLEKQRKAAERLAKEREAQEDKATAKSREKYSFWGEDVWRGSPFKNVFDRYKPTTLLKQQLQKNFEAQDLATQANRAKAAEELSKSFASKKAAITGEAAGAEVVASEAAGAGVAGAAGGGAGAMGAAAANPYILAAIVVLELLKKGFEQFKEDFKAVMGYSLSIKDTFKDIRDTISEYTNMQSGMATYGLGSSLIMNQAARQTQLQYGLSGAQAFAFDRARTLLGIQSEEDFAFMNEAQRTLFNQYMQRQTEFYDRLESSGVLQDIQEMQMDFALFKEEMAMSFMKWIADNKEEIMGVLKGSYTILKAIVSVLTFIFKAVSTILSPIGTLFEDLGLSDYESIGGNISVSDAALRADTSARSLSDRISNNSWSNSKSVNLTTEINFNGSEYQGNDAIVSAIKQYMYGEFVPILTD